MDPQRQLIARDIIRKARLAPGFFYVPIFNFLVDHFPKRDMFNRMVELHARDLDAIFHALGDRTRRGMLQQLKSSESSVGDLAKPHAMSLAAASKHVRALETAGLIRREVRGRTHYCRLEPAAFGEVRRWLAEYERFWNERLDVLADLIREEKDRGKNPQTGEET